MSTLLRTVRMTYKSSKYPDYVYRVPIADSVELLAHPLTKYLPQAFTTEERMEVQYKLVEEDDGWYEIVVYLMPTEFTRAKNPHCIQIYRVANGNLHMDEYIRNIERDIL